MCLQRIAHLPPLRAPVLPVALLFGLLITGGCDTHPRFDWPDPSPLGADLRAYEPPVDEAPDTVEASSYLVPEVLTLHDAMAAALLMNPALRRYAWEIRMAEARSLQANLLPNPEAGFEIENFGGTGELRGLRSAETTFSVSQQFLMGGKRETGMKLASLERALATFDYETTRVNVLSTTAVRFIAVLGAQERVAIAQRSHDLAVQVFEIVGKRVEAGDISPIEQTRARVTVATQRLTLQKQRRRLVLARLRLASLWSGGDAGFARAEGMLDRIPTSLPDAGSLVALVGENPDVARWAVEMSKHQTAHALARARSVPDLTATGGVRYANDVDESAFVVGFSLPIPLFDRNQGGRLETAHGIRMAREQRRETESRVNAALVTSHEALAESHLIVTTLRDEILPDAHAAFDATRTAFQEGTLGYLDMIDAQRTVIQLESDYLDALIMFHTAVAEVERLVARPLDQIATSHTEGALP